MHADLRLFMITLRGPSERVSCVAIIKYWQKCASSADAESFKMVVRT